MARHASRDTKSRRAIAARHYALRSVRPSPARAQAPVPEAWLPLADLRNLPELEVIIVPAGFVAPDLRTASVVTAPMPELEPEERTSAVERVEPALVGFVELPDLPRWDSAAPAVQASDRRGRRAAERRARTRRRRTRLTVVAGLILVVGAIVWKLLLPTHHQIDINVDGQRIRTDSSADTVGDALAEAEIWVGPFDRVQPSLDASIPARGVIEIQRAHPVVLDIDGKQQSVWTTEMTLAGLRAALKIDPALVALGVQSTPRFDPNAPVVFRSSRPVTLQADGTTQGMSTTALTVGEFLSDNAITLGPQDQVTPAPDQPVPVNGTITVTRMAAGQRMETRVVPYAVAQRVDATLAKGQTRVVQAGVNGSEQVTYQQTIRDGQVVQERVVSTIVTLPPTTKIVAVGTKAIAVAATPTPSTAAWVAQPAGTGHSESGGATWYATTAGTCAHKTIPKGTVITITNTQNGRSTTCVVADSGPYAAGRIIDLSPDTFDKIANRSQGVAPVTLNW